VQQHRLQLLVLVAQVYQLPYLVVRCNTVVAVAVGQVRLLVLVVLVVVALVQLQV
jgi:hypothetical protein